MAAWCEWRGRRFWGGRIISQIGRALGRTLRPPPPGPKPGRKRKEISIASPELLTFSGQISRRWFRIAAACFCLAWMTAANAGESAGDDAALLAKFNKAAEAFGIKISVAPVQTKDESRPMAPGSVDRKRLMAFSGGELEVHFDSDSSLPVFARNTSMLIKKCEILSTFEKTGRLRVPTRKLTDVVSAAERACGVILGSPMPDDMRLELVQFIGEDGTWGITWKRYISGYPSKGEGIWLGIDDETGRPGHYGNSRTGRVPAAPFRVGVNLADARKTAVAQAEMYARREGGEGYVVEDRHPPPSLQAVYPNFLWTEAREKMTEQELLKAAEAPRLAYVFHLGFRYTREGPYTLLFPPVIWVDAESGKVIGGG